MTYIDGFVLAVPTANRDRFRDMAERVAKVFVDHGALRAIENWGDEVPRGEVTDPRTMQAPDELNLMDPKRMIYGGFIPIVDEKGA